MGIPRLTRDITPFAEPLILGRKINHTTTSSLEGVVIDGPSLVYHVHNLAQSYAVDRLHVKAGSRNSDSECYPQPPYKIINDAVGRFLEDLMDSGAIIHRILFDGALPAFKNAERLARLEATNVHLRNFVNASQSKKLLSSNKVFAEVDFATMLWGARTLAVHEGLPPAPAFMVPSTVEYLLTSRWKHVVETVHGESDPFCAAWAAETGAAILSNDSDLILYDLGFEGCLVNFNTMQLDVHTGNRKSIRSLSLKPSIVAKQLKVLNLQDFGYQRYLDPTVRTKTISQRTRAMTSEIRSTRAFKKFMIMYPILRWNEVNISLLVSSVIALDPRAAELISSLKCGEPLRMYLPILLEDLSKNSSWSHCTHIRNCAYSILRFCREDHEEEDYPILVEEYYREGSKIFKQATYIPDAFYIYRMATELSGAHHMSDVDRLVAEQHPILAFYVLAAYMLLSQRAPAQDMPRRDVEDVLREMLGLHKTPVNASWRLVHFVANLQATLYSFRLLRQFSRYAIDHAKPSGNLLNALQQLSSTFRDMPNIEQSFLEPTILRSAFSKLPVDTLRDLQRILLHCFAAGGSDEKSE